MTQFFPSDGKQSAVKEKGRKGNYKQFNLTESKWEIQERLLNTEEINSFLEISIRAQACPMPLNIDVWDGLLCIAEGEKVKTDLGEIPIEDIQPGDFVLSLNEKTGRLENKKVIQISSTIRMNMVEIETELGTLKVTDDHPVYTQRGWIKAGELLDSDSLFTFEKD
jgi:hypothetical protein